MAGMDVRKIIAFGESTFTVTLPKKWVVANKLKKGDTVTVRELPFGKLEISPESRTEPPRSKTISIPISNRPIKEVQREFIAAYIKGYSVINLTGKHEGKVIELRRRLHELIGVEIMEVTSQRITAHVFSDITTIVLPKIISRVENISRSILDDTADILKPKANLELRYKEIVEKKREIDRQSLFAIRIIVNAIEDPLAASQMETDPLRLSFVWHLIECVEKASDYLLNVAFYMTSTDVLKRIGKRGRETLLNIFTEVVKTYEMAMSSYNKRSVRLANDVFDHHKKNDRLLYNFLHKYQNLWIPLITGYLRRMSAKSRDIAKITININTY